MDNLLNFLFGCWHKNTSFPFTSREKSSSSAQHSGATPGTYVVCLDCGKQLPYSWETMKVVRHGIREPEPEKSAAQESGIVGWLSRRGWSSRGS